MNWHSVLWGQEYLCFGGEREVEELKLFSVTSLPLLSNKICKPRSYNGTREELGKYLILLSLFTGCFHKLRNMGETMGEKKKKTTTELPAISCSHASSGVSSSFL